jgi:hypothetical protein
MPQLLLGRATKQVWLEDRVILGLAPVDENLPRARAVIEELDQFLRAVELAVGTQSGSR